MGRDTWRVEGANVSALCKLVKDSTYVEDESLDIAAIQFLRPPTFHAEYGEAVPMSRPTRLGISCTRPRDSCHLGDEVFFTGFPLQIGADSGGLEPVVRSGSIAWCPRRAREFYVDAFSLAGNSGSPVFAKRSVMGDPVALVGMVFGHRYDISDTLRKNAGLARCV